MATPPVTIAAGPPVPDSNDPENEFDPQYEAFLEWQKNELQPKANLQAQGVYDNAVAVEAVGASVSGVAATATAAAAAAAASAATALTAPGTSATSTTSQSLSTGTKVFTLAQTGKLFPVGSRAYAVSAASPTTRRMVGTVTANDPGTGAFSMSVLAAGDVTGSGTYTDWIIGIAGEGTALPATSVPDAGKVVGVTSGGVYGLLASRGGGAGTTAPFATVAAAATGIQTVTTTAHGQWIKLPAGTDYDPGIGILTIRNAGAFDLGVRDNAGGYLGFVRGNESAQLDLIDDTTAAGVWTARGLEMVGTVTSTVLAHGLSSPTGMCVREVIELDADRELLILCNGTATQAIVWDNATGAFGNLATVRTHDGALKVRATKSAANQALVVSSNSTTGLEAVTLTISGTSITVNTPATATLSAAAIPGQSLSPWGDLIPIAGQGFVFSYCRSSSVAAVRALTITGTAVAIGAESVLTGNGAAYSVLPLFDNGSSRFVVFGQNTAALVCTVFTVSGTTLTPGSNVSMAGGGQGEAFIVTKLSTGRYAAIGQAAGASFNGGIFTIIGTVPTVSTVAFSGSAGGFVGAWKNMGSSVLFAANLSSGQLYINALNDVSGVATAGTAITRPMSATTVSCLRMGSTATQLAVLWGEPTTGRHLWKIGQSGNDPVLLNASEAVAADPTGASTAINASYPGFNLSGNLIEPSGRFDTVGTALEQPGTGSAVYVGGVASNALPPVTYRSRRGSVLEMTPRPSIGRNAGQLYVRENMSTLWAVGFNPATNTTFQLTKLKAA